MFTGIIERKGMVIENIQAGQSHRLIVSASLSDLQVGESIAVNGVCLTLLPSSEQALHFDVSLETLSCTTLGSLNKGSEVNLERAMVANGRFGGHYVSGHVDKVVQVASLQPIDDYLQVQLTGFHGDDQKYLLPKGSITVEGVSLTINEVSFAKTNATIRLMLVPHTLSETTLEHLQVGQAVNIEFDYFAKIVAHQLQLAHGNKS